MKNEDFDMIISPDERSPVVLTLLSVIETLQSQLLIQSEQLTLQSQKIDLLLDEVRRLKKMSAKPKLSASKLEKKRDDNDDEPKAGTGSNVKKRPGSFKKSKNLKVDREEIIVVENVPDGAIHKGYQDYIIQELIIKPIVIKYRLERWQLPNGGSITAELPKAIKGHHFGSTLRAYVIHQHHHQGVTQPLLRAQLFEWGIDISTGQLNRLLIEDKEKFHEEKLGILEAGLSVSSYIQTDDTGARHKGINGYCTFLGNQLFSWFASTNSKSRINFLELLRGAQSDYQLIDESFVYMERYKVAPWIRHKLKEAEKKLFSSKLCWEKHLECLQITNLHYRRLVTEAALIGSILMQGFSKELVILSDDAGQFNVFLHALCWIHAERGIKALIPGNSLLQEAVDGARHEIWEIYGALLKYKEAPNEEKKHEIEKRFNDFCNKKTDYRTLNLVLQRLHKNKEELLLVLDRPEIPLHNNQSESDIREYVKKRKISGSTRSDEGRRCRDTFTSLKKTARKLGIGFWDYLIDRITHKDEILPLSELIIHASTT